MLSSEWRRLWFLTGWFDHGWIFSIPPPNVPINDTRYYGKEPGPWEGLSSEVWGSYLYFETMKRFNAAHPHRFNASGTSGRPMALSRNGGANWRTGMSSESVAGVAGHHRYPVCEYSRVKCHFRPFLPPTLLTVEHSWFFL